MHLNDVHWDYYTGTSHLIQCNGDLFCCYIYNTLIRNTKMLQNMSLDCVIVSIEPGQLPGLYIY